MAIGNPFGLEESVSQGIISAKDRRAMNDSQIEFFQTDTAINPGNSGGPLVNIRGEVFGINSAIYSQSGGNQGIGFAIPSNVVKAAMRSIISKGRVIRGYLGVAIQAVTKEIAEQFKLDSVRGAIVTDVTPGSPAEKAGIIRGDVIRKVNDYDVKDTGSLVNRIAEADVGSSLKIDLVRDGEPKSVTAQVAEQPADLVARLNRNQSDPGQSEESQDGLFAGVQVQNLTQKLRSEANVPATVNGVIVTGVDQGSPVAQQIRPGDVIGLVNATALRPGDTLYADQPVSYPPIPSFAPEHFAVVRCRDAGKYKQFRRGIDQLDTEGVVQVLSSDLRGDQAPVLAAVQVLVFATVALPKAVIVSV